MKKLYFIANIKMNFTKDEAENYITEMALSINKNNHFIGVTLPSVYLYMAQEKLHQNNILLGAQNIHHENFGAYTGEINAEMIKGFGVNFCLVGHSERRVIFNETNEMINKKVLSLLNQNIKPVICVGETLQEKQDGKIADVIETQLKSALKNVNEKQLKNIIFAYEPVWAIGTGVSATSNQADEGCLVVKNTINELYNKNIKTTVLYGGSLNLNNAKEILQQQNINGGLIGGASLNPKTFINLINTEL